MRSRWGLVSFVRQRMVRVWQQTTGVLRVLLLLVMALLLIAGGVVGLFVTSLVLLMALGGMVGHALGRWRERHVMRYSTEVEQSQLELADEFHWLHRELELQNEEIARLQRERNSERPADGS